MNGSDMLEAVGGIDEKYVNNAFIGNTQMKINASLKWLAVAAGIILTAAVIILIITSLPAGETAVPSTTEGIEPGKKAYAVYPYYADSDDVLSSSFRELTEKEPGNPDILGGYNPAYTAEGYKFKKAGLYETTMKDGSSYQMLKIDYSSVASSADGHAGYSLQLTEFEPRTNGSILTIDTVPQDVSSLFYVKCGDVYVGMDRGSLSYDEMIKVLKSVRNPDSYGCLKDVISTYGFPVTVSKLGGQDLLYFTLHEHSADRLWSLKNIEEGRTFHEGLSWHLEGTRLIISGDWNEEFIVNPDNWLAVSQKDGLIYRIGVLRSDGTFYNGPNPDIDQAGWSKIEEANRRKYGKN